MHGRAKSLGIPRLQPYKTLAQKACLSHSDGAPKIMRPGPNKPAIASANSIIKTYAESKACQ